jgi:hypothetical protein
MDGSLEKSDCYMELWNAQSIQFVWFLTTTDGIRVDALFEAFSGDEPNSVQRNKVPGPGNPFLGVAAGQIGIYQAQVQLQPGRLDLVVHADEIPNLDDIPVLETGAVLDRIYSALASNEQLLPDAVRLALVCNLLKPVETAEEGRAIATGLLSLDPALTDFTDLMFQINRKKKLQSGVSINRLLRWNTLTLQSFVLNMPGQQGVITPALKEKHAAALMLDINTVVEQRVFAGTQQVPIFKEMIEEARRLGQLGVPAALMD